MTTSSTSATTSTTPYVNFTNDEFPPPLSSSIGRNTTNNNLGSNSMAAAATTTTTVLRTSVTKDLETTLLSQRPPVMISDDTEEQHHTSYNDKRGLILFVIHILIVLAIATYYILSMMIIRYNEEFLQRYDEAIVVEYWDKLLPHFGSWYLLSILLNIFLITVAMKYILDTSICAKFLMGSTILHIILFIGACIYSFFARKSGFIDLWIIQSFVNDGGVNNFPFASTMIDIVTTLIPTSYLMMIIGYAYISLFITYLWFYLLWKTLVAGFFIGNNSNLDEIDNVLFAVFLFFHISSFWMFWTLRNVVHVMTARIVASLCLSTSPLPDVARTSASASSLQLGEQTLVKRSGIHLLGSICTGWLSDMKCMLERVFCCHNDIIYSNWVYIFVSMDDSNYETAATTTKNLLDTNIRCSYDTDYTYLRNLNTNYNVDLSAIARFIGLISVLFVVAMKCILDPPDSSINEYMAFFAIIPMLIGYTMSMSLFAIISTIIRTLFVCYYRFPNEFKRNYPTIYSRMTDVVPQCNRSTENTTTTTTATFTAGIRNNAGTTELV